MRFVDAEKVVREKKQLHQEVVRRGMDFLTEVELGNAPPIEYVVNNIFQNRQSTNEPYPSQPVSIKETVNEVR